MICTEKQLVSVIIPAFNVEKYIARCINSVLKQTYSNLEIIVINDGSTDGTVNIIKELSKVDARIVLVDLQKNKGVSYARNLGVKIANGKLISFVDSDDFIDKQMIEKLYKALISSCSDISICGFDYVDENEEMINDAPSSPIADVVLNKEELFYSLISKLYWFYITPVNKLYKKDIICNLEFKVGHRYEDEIYVHALFDSCEKASCIKDVLYHYVQHTGSFISNGGCLYDHIDCFYERYCFFKKKHYYSIAKDSLYKAVEFYKTITKKDYKFCLNRLHYLFVFVFKTGLRIYELKYKAVSIIYLFKFLINDITS